MALLGGPGTGKTYVLKHAFALQTHFAPGSLQTCAPTNAAARLIGGKTLHSACDLPIGEWTARARAMTFTKEKLLQTWRGIELLAIDEISMVSAEMFSKVEFRVRQLLQQPHKTWGGLTLLLSGDPDQLPPVQATSLFAPAKPPPTATAAPPAHQNLVDASRGLELWHQISHCVILTYTHRTQGTLQDLLAAMRAGPIPDHLWRALQSRILCPADPRSADPCYWTTNSCIGVLRHRVRALVALHRAQALARASGQRLLLILPADRASISGTPLLDPRLLQYLIRIDNLSTTKNLPGCLYLWEGASLVLENKIDEKHGLVRGCPCTLRQILLHPSEPAFENDPSLEPHILQYMPSALILHTPDITFRHSQHLLDSEFLVEPCTRTWQTAVPPETVPGIQSATADLLEAGQVTVHRRMLPLNNTLACTAYNLQGKTLTGMIADLALPPRMSHAPRRKYTCCYSLFAVTLPDRATPLFIRPSIGSPRMCF